MDENEILSMIEAEHRHNASLRHAQGMIGGTLTEVTEGLGPWLVQRNRRAAARRRTAQLAAMTACVALAPAIALGAVPSALDYGYILSNSQDVQHETIYNNTVQLLNHEG